MSDFYHDGGWISVGRGWYRCTRCGRNVPPGWCVEHPCLPQQPRRFYADANQVGAE